MWMFKNRDTVIATLQSPVKLTLSPTMANADDRTENVFFFFFQIFSKIKIFIVIFGLSMQNEIKWV